MNRKYKDHAWGAALLANMYYYFGKRKQVTNNVHAYLCMLFFFEHLPGLRASFFKDANGNLIFPKVSALPTTFPLGMSWAPHVKKVLQNKYHPVNIDYRAVMTESEVTSFTFSF